MTQSANTLDSVTVLVTRPQHQAQGLAERIRQRGGEAVLYPVIRIDDIERDPQLDKLLASVADFDIAIFISPTAVSKTLEHIPSLPPNVAVAAIGSSTAQCLRDAGIDVDITADGHDSESLLRHSRLQANRLQGKKIVIFRGRGGRELLAASLGERGAEVSYAEVYQRRRNTLQALTAATLSSIDIIAITSNEGLQNLYELTADRDALLSTPLLVPGARSENLARELGFSRIVRAQNATDDATTRALEQWASSRQLH